MLKMEVPREEEKRKTTVKEDIHRVGVTKEDAGDEMEADDPMWRPLKGDGKKRMVCNHLHIKHNAGNVLNISGA